MTDAKVDPKAELAAQAAKALGDIEAGLFNARASLHSLERMALQARLLGMFKDGDETMHVITQFAMMAGEIAAIEAKLYPLHADLTEIAIANGVDIAGPYRVLVKCTPPPGEIEPKSGGGRR